MRQTEEVELLANVGLDAVVVGALGVEVGIDQVGAAGHGVGPFYRVVEVLNESCERNLVALGGIPFVAQVGIVHVAGAQVRVALNGAGQVEVVEH